MIGEAIKKLVQRQNLSYDEAVSCMDEIMSGNTDPIQTSAFLTALSMKGETIEEITACAVGMRAHCKKLENAMDVLEIVGTGGDGSNSFNISTTSAIVVAAAGVPIAKHGNRSASSKSGAADCLEALGVNIVLEPEKAKELLEKINICFLFAQNYHQSMKYVAPVRKMLGIKTVFNLLGPLTNPAGANMQLLGVYDESLVRPMAEVLMKLGVKRGMVVYGQERLDEISVTAPTTICDFTDGTIKEYVIEPENFGIERCKKEDILGGEPAENAKITLEILNGELGAKRNAVLMNAGAGLYVAGKVKSIADGIALAAETIDSKKAKKKLEEFIALSNV